MRDYSSGIFVFSRWISGQNTRTVQYHICIIEFSLVYSRREYVLYSICQVSWVSYGGELEKLELVGRLGVRPTKALCSFKNI